VASPDNARANRELRADPAFKRRVSLEPQTACPRFLAREARSSSAPGAPAAGAGAAREKQPPHLTTAEVWEEVHRKTGLPIVADYYSRLYPVASVTVRNRSLFDALCRAGDEMRVRWKKDGDFLLSRSTSFFWDKLKEVPNRHLRRWQKDSLAGEGLPLADVLEMATLSDAQLDSKIVGEVIAHCWETGDWRIVGHAGEGRANARFLASLTPEQLRRILWPEGLRYEELAPEQQQNPGELGIFRNVPPQQLPGARFNAAYVPGGRYVWYPVIDLAGYRRARDWPVVAEPTADAALARARRADPTATPAQIRFSEAGFVILTAVLADGTRVVNGQPPLSLRSP
jgi:hypothetical protein